MIEKMEETMEVFLEKATLLLSDQDFDNLEIALSEPNIFRALRYERKETMHSNFLAYLLNPNENHGLGSSFLQKILIDVFGNNNKKTNVLDIDNINFNTVEIRREWRNIDILVISKEYLIVIENKIDSQDHDSQLEKYYNIIKVDPKLKKKKRHFVYLTPTGTEPLQESMKKIYMSYSYNEIGERLETTYLINQHKMSQRTNIYIKDYLTILRQDLLMNDELNSKATEFYLKHQELLDFLYENKPDLCSQMHNYLVEELEGDSIRKDSNYEIASSNKGYTRFYPKILKKIVDVKKGNTWKGEESFCFELIYYKKDGISKNIILKATISRYPDNNDEHRRKLIAAFTNIEPKFISRDVKEDSQCVVVYPDKKYYKDISPINTHKIIDLNENQIKKEVSKYVSSFKDFVDMVTDEIIKEFKKK